MTIHETLDKLETINTDLNGLCGTTGVFLSFGMAARDVSVMAGIGSDAAAVAKVAEHMCGRLRFTRVAAKDGGLRIDLLSPPPISPPPDDDRETIQPGDYRYYRTPGAGGPG